MTSTIFYLSMARHCYVRLNQMTSERTLTSKKYWHHFHTAEQRSRQTMVRPAFRHKLLNLLHVLSFPHPVHPVNILRILFLESIHLAQLLEQSFAHRTPRHEGQVSIGALVSNEPAAAIALEAKLDHTKDAEDFIHIAVDGAGDLLGMEASEPGRLAEVWTLACEERSACGYTMGIGYEVLTRDLESEPLLCEIFLRHGRVRDFVIFIVLIDQILDDGSRLRVSSLAHLHDMGTFSS